MKKLKIFDNIKIQKGEREKMIEKRIDEIVDLIAVSEKIISNPLTSSEEKEKRRLLIGVLVDSVLDEGGLELFFKMEEKMVDLSRGSGCAGGCDCTGELSLSSRLCDV